MHPSMTLTLLVLWLWRFGRLNSACRDHLARIVRSTADHRRGQSGRDIYPLFF